MSEFNSVKQAVTDKFNSFDKDLIFVTNVDKDELWNTYLNSFKEGDNPVFRERTEHDCTCCKQFIRTMGAVVTIVGDNLVSIWSDLDLDNKYSPVAKALDRLVLSKPIKDVFYHYEKSVGTDFNYEKTDIGTVKWEHFHCKLPDTVVKRKDAIPTLLGEIRETRNVFRRGVDELTLDAANTVLELIEQNSLYRGEEHKISIIEFIKNKKAYDKVANKDIYAWSLAKTKGMQLRFRNSVIGTLVTDLSNDVPLDDAVKMFESKVAPANYKRPKALITQSMIDKAEKTIIDLGYEESLQRRYAVAEDITINNVLFADRSAKKALGVLGELKPDKPTKQKFTDVEEVKIDDFIANILPKATSIELMVSNKHQGNFVSLIAPVVLDSKNILSWDNNFSWSYANDVTDSITKNVKKAGGNIIADMRFSIQWNDKNDNPDDLDAHCLEANGNLIDYRHKRSRITDGFLDIDIQNPKGVAVENIAFKNKNRLTKGNYNFKVHCYSSRGAISGFSAEVVIGNDKYQYNYPKALYQNQFIDVATVNWNGKEFSIEHKLKPSSASIEMWGINTQQFTKVKMVMQSPNHWDDNNKGNKHFFFMLEDCINPEASRGLYNEFLSNDLHKHRKVLEVLGNKLKTPESNNQLSGVGFSSTNTNDVLVKVSGTFNRTIKLKF